MIAIVGLCISLLRASSYFTSGHVVQAIQTEPHLPFDMDRLEELIKLNDGSWSYHKAWFHELEDLLIH